MCIIIAIFIKEYFLYFLFWQMFSLNSISEHLRSVWYLLILSPQKKKKKPSKTTEFFSFHWCQFCQYVQTSIIRIKSRYMGLVILSPTEQRDGAVNSWCICICILDSWVSEGRQLRDKAKIKDLIINQIT